MDSGNPFSPGSANDRDIVNQGGTRDPARLDPMAIISRCWEITQENPGIVAAAFLIPLVPNVAFQVVQQVLQVSMEEADEELMLPLLLALIGVAVASGLVQLFFQVGMVRIYTRLARGLPADVSMLFGEVRNYVPALLASVLTGLAVVCGLMVLIIPGIILSLGLQFYLYALIDQELDPIAAMQESWRLTDGYKSTVFGINLVIFLIALAFICATCGFGALLVAPVLAITQGVMYHSLLNLQPKS
jgi:hypothetical protein